MCARNAPRTPQSCAPCAEKQQCLAQPYICCKPERSLIHAGKTDLRNTKKTFTILSSLGSPTLADGYQEVIHDLRLGHCDKSGHSSDRHANGRRFRVHLFFRYLPTEYMKLLARRFEFQKSKIQTRKIITSYLPKPSHPTLQQTKRELFSKCQNPKKQHIVFGLLEY